MKPVSSNPQLDSTRYSRCTSRSIVEPATNIMIPAMLGTSHSQLNASATSCWTCYAFPGPKPSQPAPQRPLQLYLNEGQHLGDRLSVRVSDLPSFVDCVDPKITAYQARPRARLASGVCPGRGSGLANRETLDGGTDSSCEEQHSGHFEQHVSSDSGSKSRRIWEINR